jgi:hypothetical protein
MTLSHDKLRAFSLLVTARRFGPGLALRLNILETPR